MKRVMTFVSAIIGTVLLSISALIAIVDFSTTMEALRHSSLYYVNIPDVIMSTWNFLLVIPTLILNALAISTFRCTHEQYARRRKTLIATAVMDFVWAFGMVLSFILISITAFEMLLFLAFIALGVLVLVDMNAEHDRLDKLAQQNAPTATDVEVTEREQQ